MTKQEHFLFLDILKAAPYGDYYVDCVLHNLDKMKTGRKINLDSFFTVEYMKDRLQLMEAVNYIFAADLLKKKLIKFEQPKTFENYIFYLKQLKTPSV